MNAGEVNGKIIDKVATRFIRTGVGSLGVTWILILACSSYCPDTGRGAPALDIQSAKEVRKETFSQNNIRFIEQCLKGVCPKHELC